MIQSHTVLRQQRVQTAFWAPVFTNTFVVLKEPESKKEREIISCWFAQGYSGGFRELKLGPQKLYTERLKTVSPRSTAYSCEASITHKIEYVKVIF